MTVVADVADDEKLSNKEFVAVMKRRLMRGLERPRETGFTKLFTAIAACSKSMVSEKISGLRGKATE